MNILGINAYHADSSACIFINNELKFAVEEERLNRIKHWSGLPILSIEACLQYCEIELSDVDFIIINQNSKKNLKEKIIYSLKNISISKLLKSIEIKNLRKNISSDIYKKFSKSKKKPKILYCEHHLAHVYSSFSPSGYKESCFLSLDGFGDFVSTMEGFVDNRNIEIGKKIFFPHSLGILYQAVTQFLGFDNYGDEYKVMGLASYGTPKEVTRIQKLIKYNYEGDFELNLDFFTHHTSKFKYSLNNKSPFFSKIYSENIMEVLGCPRLKNQHISSYQKDLAASLQKVYEEIFFLKLNSIYKKYNNQNLVLSGGCIHNSVANGKIKNNTSFKNIYIPPAPGDAGGAIGSVFYLLNKDNKTHPINQSYLGNCYLNSFIESCIKQNQLLIENNNCKVTFIQNFKSVCDYVSLSLTRAKIIGWFQGRMEWGPRALGNRSILGDPRNIDFKNLINKKIKKREDFRPFAPSILHEYVNDWLEVQNIFDPYMSGVYMVKQDKKHLIPAVTHFDGSARAQTVTRDLNKKYYELIESFFNLTGIPMLLNTSFNENEPIVNTPQEAIDCFLRTKMDVLVIENWIIERNFND
jgi:carbamoyltransferase